MSDDVTITVRVNNQTAAGFRDVNGRIRDMNGRFATAAGDMQRSSARTTASINGLKATLLSLAPAAVPVAAAMAPIVTQAGAAALAVGAFGAAIVPQISNLSDAAKAQTKYTDAVRQYGRGSEQAAKAALAQQQTLASMPAATQHAAAAWSNLSEQFKGFSDSTAKFTMAPVEKSFAILGQIIPKLTPMVQGTSTQLSRLMDVAGGGVNSAAFDTLSKKVSDFSNTALKGATDRAIHFMRVLSEGNASGPIASFFEYARKQGPAVKELLGNVSEAVSNLMQGAAQAGPGLLTLVNAMAKLVASMPPELVGTLMQIYAAFKLIKLAGAGIGVIGDGLQSVATRMAALRAASVAAGGGVAGLRAAFASLGAAAKASVVVAGIGLLAVGVQKLAEKARGAPPDVDKLALSLKNLAATGKATGELKASVGDVGDFVKKLNSLKQEQASLDKGLSWAKGIAGIGPIIDAVTPKIDDLVNGSKSMGAAKDDFAAFDKALAQNASNGHATEMAAQFKQYETALKKAGYTQKEINALFPAYTSVVADAKYEQQMAAQSMGLFGSAAQAAQAKLDAQKSSADGLRQSIVALNDAQRQGLGGMIGFEAAIDAAAKAATDNAGALSMTHGVLDLNSEKARSAASALQDLADKTDSAASSARESNASWETVNGIYSRGREELIKQAHAMGLTTDEAKILADQILQIPDKTTTVKMNTEDALAGLTAFNEAVTKTPNAKSVTLKTLSSSAEAILESFGLKVKRLPDGSVTVSAKTGAALGGIAGVAAAIARLKDKTVTLTTVTRFTTQGTSSKVAPAHRDYAAGGRVRGYASGGDVQAYPDGGYIEGPGSGTSDSILTLLGSGNVVRSSNTEFIVNAQQTRKHRRLLELINSGQLPRFAKGGLTDAEKSARSSLRGQMSISALGRSAGYSRTSMEKALGAPSDLSSLVSALNSLKTDVRSATRGKSESSLLRTLDSVGKRLIGQEKALAKVNSALEKAKSKLDDLKNSASQLSSSVRGGVLSAANITKGASGTNVTAGTVIQGLTDSRDKATAFADALKGLKGKGLNASLIQQIAEAGIEGGGLETAGALMSASAGDINAINSLQGQINSAAGAAGKATSDAVYGAAIKAQTAATNKLQASQDRLEKTMASLAKSLEKAISRAIGKKAAGGIVGAAASGGIRGGLTWVGEHEPELLDLPVGSRVWSGPDSRRKAAAPWDSMLNTPRRAGPSGGGSVGGGAVQPVVVHQTITLDGRVVARQIFEPLREEVRGRGGNVQDALGQRGK
ncbi:phage tail protein [Streptomyces sp. NPDC001315]|uniref:phage tail protein n=1 Tax=Streptomyces sp. NPDC001315 TaxID=3364562 RepID=UPI00367AE55B